MEKNNIFPGGEPPRFPRWDDLPDIELDRDQVIALMSKYFEMLGLQDDKALTPSMINNYVKMGVLPSPVKKKYSKNHLAHLFIICMLKQVLPLQGISALIKAQLRGKSEQQLFDCLSLAYEDIFTREMKEYSELFDCLAAEESDLESVFSMFAFRAAAVSNYARIVSERAVSSIDEKDQPEEKTEKKEKPEKK